MCLRFALSILLGVCAFSLSAEDRPERIPIVIADLDERLFSVREIQFSDGGRNWSQEDLANYNMRQSFNTWIRCFQNSSPECEVCELNGPSPVTTIITTLGTNCLPPPSDAQVVFYEHLLPSQKQRRDDRICGCYANGNAGPIESYSFAQGIRSRASRGQVWEREKVLRNNANEERVIGRLMTERFAFGFSAASFVNNPEDALEIASRYSARGSGIGTQDEGSSNRGRGGRGAHSGSAVEAAEREELNSQLFNGTNLPVGYCLPYRNFLASKQFPISAKFYEDLDSQSETDFDPQNWDYMVLLDQLKAKVGPGGDVHQVIQRDLSARRLHARIRFLHNNPAMKNIFLSSGNLEMKRELFRKIKAMPRPNCGPDACTRDDRWTAAMGPYRIELADFLSRQNVISAARDGSKISRELTLMLAEDEARMIASSADSLIPDGKLFDPAEWSTFCDARRVDRAASTTGSTGFLQNLLEGLGNRDFQDYTQDTEYGRANADLCTQVRVSSNGEDRLSFNQYFAQECPQGTTEDRCREESRMALVNTFLNLYPGGGDSPTVASLRPFISGALNLGIAKESDISKFNQVAKSPELARRPVRFSGAQYAALNNSRGDVRELSKSELALVRAENLGPVSTEKVSSVPQGQQNPQAQQLQSNSLALPNQGQEMQRPIFAPQTQPRPEERPLETARNQLVDGESRTREIREEISSIQNLLRRETEAPAPNATVINGLNQRLADWERRFREQSQTNLRLQDQIAELERTPSRRARASEAPQEASSIVSRRPASVSEQREAASFIPQGGSAGGSLSAPVNSGGFAAGGGLRSLGGSSSSRVSRGSSEEGSLGRFGVQNYSVRNGITVAEASSTIDYQRLRSESAGSILPLRVTADEFSQFSQNLESAIAQYVDRVRAIPGSVVRVDLQGGTDQSMEIFVVKNGEGISIVQAPGMQLRAPASVPEVQTEREFTLQGLQNELTR